MVSTTNSSSASAWTQTRTRCSAMARDLTMTAITRRSWHSSRIESRTRMDCIATGRSKTSASIQMKMTMNSYHVKMKKTT